MKKAEHLSPQLFILLLLIATLLISTQATSALNSSAWASSASICKEGGCTYVANLVCCSVGVISPSNKLIATIFTGAEGCPNSAAYDPRTKMIFVPDLCLDEVYVINPATNKVVHTITGIEAPLFIVCDDKIPMCFATDWDYGTVTPFSPTKLTVGTPVKQCNRNPEFLAFDPVNGMLYVGNVYRHCVTVENPVTGATKTISVGYGIAGISVAKSGMVYVDDALYNVVFLIKGTRVLQNISMPEGVTSLWGNTYDPEDNLVWVDSAGSNQAVPINGTIVGTPVKTGNVPDGACTDSVNGEVYVTNINSNPPTVTVIKGTAVVKTVHLNDQYIEPFGCASN